VLVMASRLGPALSRGSLARLPQSAIEYRRRRQGLLVSTRLAGAGPDSAVIGSGMAEQTRQALANLRTCLQAAGAEVTDIVKWTIHYVEGADLQAGLKAFREFWPGDAAPPAITVVEVSGIGPAGALVEIDAVAATRS
jgi:enamine deaminase RidA (YjgF/YER057c/UK114 family)